MTLPLTSHVCPSDCQREREEYISFLGKWIWYWPRLTSDWEETSKSQISYYCLRIHPFSCVTQNNKHVHMFNFVCMLKPTNKRNKIFCNSFGSLVRIFFEQNFATPLEGSLVRIFLRKLSWNFLLPHFFNNKECHSLTFFVLICIYNFISLSHCLSVSLCFLFPYHALISELLWGNILSLEPDILPLLCPIIQVISLQIYWNQNWNILQFESEFKFYGNLRATCGSF